MLVLSLGIIPDLIASSVVWVQKKKEKKKDRSGFGVALNDIRAVERES